MNKMEAELTTLCYIEKDGKYLMLHRTKKENDPSRDLWLGIGGHFEHGESPEECMLREVKEESGLSLTAWKLRGIVTFSDGDWFEYMFLYSADGFTGEMTECTEGELVWVEKDKVINDLPIWEGDRIFLRLMDDGEPFFSLRLKYENRKLVYAAKDGIEIRR